MVDDALAILAALDGVELDERQAEAVGLLALVAGQDVEEGDEPGSWRIARRTVKDRIVSTVDPESRHVHKNRTSYTDGFKAHVSVEPETGLIVAKDLTAGNVHDGPAGLELVADEPDPVEVLADSAYGAGQVRDELDAAGHTQTIKPIPLRTATDHPDGFTLDDFTIDLDARVATCPAGSTVPISDNGHATFGARCDGCPMRPRCTRAKAGKKLNIHPHHQQLARARRDAQDPDWQDRYRRHRPMVERTIAWLVARGHRRVRYRGIDRNQIWLAHRAAAVNLTRLLNLGLTHDHTGWRLPAPA
jgi:IS5 family transposase